VFPVATARCPTGAARSRSRTYTWLRSRLEIDLQIERTVAVSFAGVFAQLEVLRENLGENPLLDTIIAGVKRLAGGVKR
jgi:hypothetical protein